MVGVGGGLVALRSFSTIKKGTRTLNFQSNDPPLKFLRQTLPYEVPLGKKIIINNNKTLEPYGLYYRQRYSVASDMSRPTRGNYSRNKFSERKNTRIKCWTCAGPHRQSEYEEPPMRVRCSETGHKAKYCVAPAPISQPQENF
jgi:hypothetical protein